MKNKKGLENRFIHRRISELGRKIFGNRFMLLDFLDRTIRKKGNLEMSRYIDIAEYNRTEEVHPFYKEMRELMVNAAHDIIRSKYNGVPPLLVDLGAGTGLLDSKLIELAKKTGVPPAYIHLIEIDEECVNYLRKFERVGTKVFPMGVERYLKDKERVNGNIPILLSSFSHDHFAEYEEQEGLLRTISSFLGKNGVYILGGEFINRFTNEREREVALLEYHEYIINTALKRGTKEDLRLIKLEFGAMLSGLFRIGDFKTSILDLKEKAERAGMDMNAIRIGPRSKTMNEAGVYVCTLNNKTAVPRETY